VTAAPSAVVLVRAYRTSGDESARRRVIEQYMPLVVKLARRYTGRGESLEDLIQVGSEGLIKAVDRFEPDKGVGLGAYAIPTIVGEIKRHLRDRTWPVSVPRPIRESSPISAFVVDEPAREPTGGEQPPAPDFDWERSEQRALLADAYRALDDRERRVVHLRFFAELSQAEIARALGMSQVQVSRLVSRSLEKMRDGIGDRAATNGGPT
jgi:RNA polymerase sigma-B factor